LAFSGLKITPSAQLREKGMRRALAEHPEVRLRQLVYGAGPVQRAYEQAKLLFKRYPQTSLVWSANDEMSFGAMQAFEETGGKPGKDALFSAINNSPAALHALLDNRLSVLLGGHFTLGGWALVQLHDYNQGVDFSRYGGRDRQISLLQVIDRTQAKRLLALGSEKIRCGFSQILGQGAAGVLSISVQPASPDALIQFIARPEPAPASRCRTASARTRP
jgi:hypothetical protein